MISKKVLGFFVGIMFFPVVAFSQNIADVSKGDPSFSAISKSVKLGYLSLFDGDSFLGDQPVSRKDLAIVIDKLSTDMSQDSTGALISKGDAQELKNFMRLYKKFIVEHEGVAKSAESRLTLSEGEQKVLNTDMSKLNNSLRIEINSFKSEINSLKQEQLYLWVGVVGSAILGSIIFK